MYLWGRYISTEHLCWNAFHKPFSPETVPGPWGCWSVALTEKQHPPSVGTPAAWAGGLPSPSPAPWSGNALTLWLPAAGRVEVWGHRGGTRVETVVFQFGIGAILINCLVNLVQGNQTNLKNGVRRYFWAAPNDHYVFIFNSLFSQKIVKLFSQIFKSSRTHLHAAFLVQPKQDINIIKRKKL